MIIVEFHKLHPKPHEHYKCACDACQKWWLEFARYNEQHGVPIERTK